MVRKLPERMARALRRSTEHTAKNEHSRRSWLTRERGGLRERDNRMVVLRHRVVPLGCTRTQHVKGKVDDCLIDDGVEKRCVDALKLEGIINDDGL